MAISNNDILIRVRYALDIKDTDMVEIFKLGGVEVTKEEVRKMLTKLKNSYYDEVDDIDVVEYDYEIKCNNVMLESFLNGFITFKRGKQDPKPGQSDRQAMSLKSNGSVNNLVLKN